MRKHQLRFKLVALLIGASLAFLLAELAVRLLGFGPWPGSGRMAGAAVVSHEPDPLVGWRKRAGRFEFECLNRRIVVTHWDGDLRAAATERTPQTHRVMLLGGSFAYGYCLSDDETLAWHLQARFPDVEVQNRATIGYGTYQSLLVLEQYFATEGIVPTLVIYGFNQFHDFRNVAPQPRWQYWWAWKFPSERINLPYVRLGPDGSLQRKSRMYPDWPLKRYSAFVALLERGYTELRGLGRRYRAQAVMQQLILEMDRLTRAGGSRLLVMAMGRSNELDFLAREGILAVDCAPRRHTPDLYLSDGHPSAELNADYETCLTSFLETEQLLASP